MKQQINFNKIARKIRHKMVRLERKPTMAAPWRKFIDEDINRLDRIAGRFVYFHEPRPYNGLRKRMVPAVAMPDGTYQPAW